MTAGELTHGSHAASEPSDSSVPSAPAHAAPSHTPARTIPSASAGNPEVLLGPLSARALLRLDEALRLADASTGLTFSVYIGELEEPVREDAEEMLYRLADPHHSVLIAVSPNQRLLEIVTGSVAATRILDRDCKLAALSMSAAFAGGDLGGGLVAGLAQLAEHAGRPS